MSQHVENLAAAWAPLLSSPQEIPGVVATTIQQGGTRPAWNVERAETQTMLMAWPEASLLRSAVVVHGPREGRLDPVAPIPLLEGFPNAMEVAGVHAWEGGLLGEVEVLPPGGGQPLWFHDPLFFRDNVVDLTPGVTQTFYLAGLCFGLRRALLDELTITSGPNYEAYAAAWLEENPGKSRLDVPLLKIPLTGLSVLAPGQHLSEYQARCRIYDVDSFLFGPPGAEVKIYRFGTAFGSEEHPIHVILYAPEKLCLNGYVPEEGHEIDSLFWMQGRIVDSGDEAGPESDQEDGSAGVAQ